MSEELQPQELEVSGQTVETPTTVSFSFESRFDDVLQAARVIDHKNRAETRRGIQSMGIVLILWMFVPELFKNPALITNWIMVALSIALGVMLWKYPDQSNRKFAASKVALAPTVSLTVDGAGITIDGEGGGTISYADIKAIYDYKDILVVSYHRNHILTIPKTQLDAATLAALRAILGDRCESVEAFKEVASKKEKAQP